MRLLLAILLFTSLPIKANDFNTLRYMLLARNNEPKMYLPDISMLGSEINILVVAPQAKSIQLLASTEEGETKLEDLDLSINKNFKELGYEESSKAKFIVPLDPEKDKELADKFYYFEAIITYEHPEKGEVKHRASFYGANANFSNINAVKVLPIPKDYSGAANIARSVIPGLGGRRF